MGKNIVRGYLRFVEVICVVLLMIMLICMCIQVGCRIFTIGQNFTEELARISFCLMCFLGAPLAYAEGSHIAVDMVVNMLPNTAKKFIELIVNALIAVFACFCLRSLVTYMGSNNGVTAVSMTWIKMNWIFGTIFISFICMAIMAIVKFVLVIVGKKETVDIHEEEKRLERESEGEVDLGI